MEAKNQDRTVQENEEEQQHRARRGERVKKSIDHAALRQGRSFMAQTGENAGGEAKTDAGQSKQEWNTRWWRRKDFTGLARAPLFVRNAAPSELGAGASVVGCSLPSASDSFYCTLFYDQHSSALAA